MHNLTPSIANLISYHLLLLHHTHTPSLIFELCVISYSWIHWIHFIGLFLIHSLA